MLSVSWSRIMLINWCDNIINNNNNNSNNNNGDNGDNDSDDDDDDSDDDDDDDDEDDDDDDDSDDDDDDDSNDDGDNNNNILLPVIVLERWKGKKQRNWLWLHFPFWQRSLRALVFILRQKSTISSNVCDDGVVASVSITYSVGVFFPQRVPLQLNSVATHLRMRSQFVNRPTPTRWPSGSVPTYSNRPRPGRPLSPMSAEKCSL